MTNDNPSTRRRVLKALSAGAAVTSIGTIEAQSVAATDANESIDSERTRDLPDLRVKNKSREMQTLSIEISEVEKNDEGDYEEVGGPVYKQSFSLEGRSRSPDNPSNAAKRPLSVEGDTVYKFEVSTTPGNETVGSDLIGIPSGGVPEYMTVMADLTPSNKIEVYPAKE